MRLIDFHSHFFSRVFFRTLAEQAAGKEAAQGKLEAIASTGIEIPAPQVEDHVKRWIAQLDEHGVEHLVTFASLPEEVETVAEAARLSNGRFTPVAMLNPVAPKATELVERVSSEGFAGVLLFPAMHHYFIGSRECAPVLEVLDAKGAIVFLHCGLLVVKLRDLLGLPRPYDLSFADPLSVIPAANAHRNIRFVIPHFGAGFFRETLMAGTQCENVFVDTSSSNSWIVTQPGLFEFGDVFKAALEVFGAERILFGTDSGTFPAGWRKDRLDEQHRALAQCGATPADQDKIFGANAARLLGI